MIDVMQFSFTAGEFELVSTITLVLQIHRWTKWANQPEKN